MRSKAEHTGPVQESEKEKSEPFKSEAMTNFIVKTHRKDTSYSKPHLFILNKGLNSGKPQKEPFTNSFVIIFQQDEDCEILAPILNRFGYPFLTPPGFQKRIQSKSQKHDGRTRAASKKHYSTKTIRTKGISIPRKFETYK